jgi:ferritin-like metal-binding protein YciE
LPHTPVLTDGRRSPIGLSQAAQEPELKKAITKHREETQGQIERLDQVFEMIGKRAQGKSCEAINGIVAEGDEMIEAR